MTTTLAPVPPGTYPNAYEFKIRPIDWELIKFVIKFKSLDLSSASYHLGVPVSSLQNSLEYLKSIGILHDPLKKAIPLIEEKEHQVQQ